MSFEPEGSDDASHARPASALSHFPVKLQLINPQAPFLKGADLLLWFEPERVRPGTQLDGEHPEWLLRAEGNDNALLFLGNPECRQWLTDHVGKLIADNGEWGTYAWSALILGTPGGRIAGGSDEIMRNIVGERVLGLPKDLGIDSKSPFKDLKVGTQKD